MKHYFFLFDSRKSGSPSGSYGGVYKHELLKALFDSNCIKNHKYLLSVGDLLIPQGEAYVPTEILSRGGVAYDAISDSDRYKKLAAYLIEYISLVPNSIDVKKNWKIIMDGSTYIIGLSTESIEDIGSLESNLKKCPGYLGYFEMTMIDGLIDKIFFGSIFRDIFIEGNNIFSTREDNYLFDSEKLKRIGMSFSPCEYEKFSKMSLGYDSKPSYVSSISPKLTLILKKSFDRVVLDAMINQFQQKKEINIFNNLDIKKLKSFNIPSAKLKGYALNPEHDVGMHKAKVFKRHLSIGLEDWQYLENEIRSGLLNCEVKKISVTDYGIKFSAFIQILGKNGIEKTAEIGWLLDTEKGAKLTTVYVADENKQRVQQKIGQTQYLLPSDLQGNERMIKLFELADLAGQEEVKKTVPIPMIVSMGWKDDSNLFFEEAGKMGSADIDVLDTKCDFAKWLKKYKDAYIFKKRMRFYVSIDSSFDLSKAYADAFVRVLNQNGVEAVAIENLD